jgi:aquaporin Z
MLARLAAEFFGTLWLVLGGCGAAVLTATFPQVGIGILGVSFAFGLTVLTMAYAVGHVSGGHFNPAVTLGLVAGGRFKAGDALPYIIAQVLGAILGAGLLYIIAIGNGGAPLNGGFAANGFGAHSPGKYAMLSAFICEVVMTFFFLIIILGATHRKAPQALRRLPSGLA